MKAFYVTLYQHSFDCRRFHRSSYGRGWKFVIGGVGLLLMFAVVNKIPKVIATRRSAKISKGDASLEVITNVLA